MRRITCLLLLVIMALMVSKGTWAAEAYAVLSSDNTTLTFYYDDNKTSQSGMSVGPFALSSSRGWYNQKSSITTVVFDQSFANCTTLTSTNLWFSGCKNLSAINGIENLKTDNVTTMTSMFYDCSSLTSLDLHSFNTEKVTDMYKMFEGCSSLTNLDVSSFKTDNVTNMSCMFWGCMSLTSLDVSNFNTENVENMFAMFLACWELTSLDVSGFKTDKAETMAMMFENCAKLQQIDVSGFNTRNVGNMKELFFGCASLTSIDVTGFNTEKVQDMSSMFMGCDNLTSLDLSNFSTAGVRKDNDYWCVGAMCRGLKKLETLIRGKNFTKFGTNTFNTTSLKTVVSYIEEPQPIGNDVFYSMVKPRQAVLYVPVGTKAKYEVTDGWKDFKDIVEKDVIDPIEGETTISTETLGNENLSDNVVDDVYYNVSTEGYDSSDGSIVIDQTTDMSQISDATPGSEDVKNNFTGLILKVAAGKGTITVNVKTTGNAQLVVQIGNGTPMIATKTEQGDVVVSYDVTEDTYVYIYAIIGSSAAWAMRAPSTDVVKIYGITVTPGATGIDAIHRSQSIVHDYYTPDGRKLEGVPAKKGLYIVNGRKVAIK